jgi:hypothetical protein
VECSDGSNSWALWGATTIRANQGDPFTEGTFGTGCRGFGVAYEPQTSINKLDFTDCGGGEVGGYITTESKSASLRCPTGMQVVGLFGAYETVSYGLLKVGLYCM